MLVADRGEPSGVDESAVAVQRKRSRPIRVDNDGDDLADARLCAVGEERVEQVSANAATAGVRCDVHRILHGVPVGGPGLPRCAVGIADDLAVEGGGQKRQS